MARAFRVVALLVVAAAAGATLGAQTPQRLLSVEAIYHPERRVDFSGAPVTDITWLDAETYLTTRREGRGVQWTKVDAVSGRSSPLFDAGRMEAALSALPGVSREEATRLPRSSDLTFNSGHSSALLTISDDLYAYDFAPGKATRLT